MALASACNPTYQAGSSGNTDDVYYSPHDKPQSQQAPASTNPSSGYSQNNGYQAPENNGNNQNNSGYNQDNSDYSQDPSQQNSRSTTSQTTDGSGNTYVTNNYYNTDDYYDYAYSARIKRFYNPADGYGYYDPYYTNAYWYDYSPASYGVSIYMGYNWWAPSYYYYSPFAYPTIGFSYGWGYPYYGFSIGFGFGFGYGYGYGYGYPYYPYYGGYYGYGCGYYGYGCGYNPCYYNSYDSYNNVYYGPRGGIASDGGKAGPTRPPRSVGDSYESAVIGGKIAPSNPDLTDRIRSQNINSSRQSESAPGGGRSSEGKSNTISRDRNSEYNTNPATGSGKNSEGRDMKTEPRYNAPSTGSETPGTNPGRGQNGAGERPDTRPNTQPSNFGETPDTKTGRPSGTTPGRENQYNTPDTRSNPGYSNPDTRPGTGPDRRENTQPKNQPDMNSPKGNNGAPDMNRYQRARTNSQNRTREEGSKGNIFQRVFGGGEKQQAPNAQPGGRQSTPSAQPGGGRQSSPSAPSRGNSGGGRPPRK